METIEVRRSIAAPIADVFDWISNAGNYTDSPLFLAAKLIRSGSAAAYGVGAIRRFTFPFAVVHEEITRFDPPYSFSYRVIKCVPPVRHEGGAVVLTPTAHGTDLMWSSSAELRLPVFAVQITRAILPRLFGRAFSQVLDAAQSALEANHGHESTARPSADGQLS
ncbi:SRPBCC family protein [Mycobacteroides abscessus]|uniref:Polyketide cyclase / dehydrase and lipid transport n=4 Tax=Mycobacteroides abscessus TaxID=36809 RepID=A0A1U3CUH2_9MYCO|nr:SRPBCC family protein [Mycobacteroides abscessus]ESV63406.1 polyketide cyclase / dehydrase and lipid transport family protein [Mycobacteroides abscessus MAB_091912_2446]AGM28817.1 hypothetical protein MASS_2215 [Mycobacteroides abscessus subsp. bolletii 50594]AIC72254.1 hypothetical protein MYCMA_09345 [Mycobacteroides abscessus subsp. massiliense str. GO 06]AMU25972.1 hypothetical protein A3N96_11505 [Mycobacteroides abscessus]AMU35649.1 hypothetical protein A3N98_10700 [Mycobacteroides ab